MDTIQFCEKYWLYPPKNAILQVMSDFHFTILASFGTMEQFQTGLELFESQHGKKYQNWHSALCMCALSSENLELLKFLLKQGCPINIHDGAVDLAAHDGHLKAIQYGQKLGYKLTRETCVSASMGNQFEIVKYLLDQGCPWDLRKFSES